MTISNQRPPFASYDTPRQAVANGATSADKALAPLRHLGQQAATARARETTSQPSLPLDAIRHEIRGLIERTRSLEPDERHAIGQQLLAFITEQGVKFPDKEWREAFFSQQADIVPLMARPILRPAAQNTAENDLTARPTVMRPVAPKPQPGAQASASDPAKKPGKLRGMMSKWRGTVPQNRPAVAEMVGMPQDGRVPSGEKVRLFLGDTILQAESTRVLGYVDIPKSNRVERKPFRASLIQSKGLTPLLQGSAIAAGTFGKIVPIVYRDSSGHLTAAVGKMMRKQEPKNLEQKAPFNRFGGRRNIVGDDASFEYEVSMQQLLGGPVRVLGARSYEDKRMMILTSMDMCLSEAASFCPDHRRSALARDSLAQLARHQAEIHKLGYVHGDGKPQNALVNLKGGMVVNSDFGGAIKLAKGQRAFPPSTILSPESVSGQGVSFAHDVFVLGITGLMVLEGTYRGRHPLVIALDPQGKADLAGSRKGIAMLKSFRSGTLKKEGRGAGLEVDESRLQRALLEPTPIADMLRNPYMRDAKLTMYILGSLLQPEESLRVTSAQAAEDLARLNQRSSQAAGSVYDAIHASTGHMRQAQEKLFSLAEMGLL